MTVDTWIGRAILDQLSTYDRRYRHDYGGVEKTTDDLVGACAKLDAIADERDWPRIETVLAREQDLEPEVEATLEALAERGYVEQIDERERLGPPLEPGDYGTVAVWEPTDEGLAEVSALRERYEAELRSLVGDDLDTNEEGLPDLATAHEEALIELATTYGILPDRLG